MTDTAFTTVQEMPHQETSGLLLSPFGSTSLLRENEDEAVIAEMPMTELASPFAEAMAVNDETEFETLAFEAVMEEIRDDRFEEAVQGLIDEAAARHLTSSAAWSSEAESGLLAVNEVEAWLGGVETESDRFIARLEERFSGRTIETFNFEEFEAEADRMIAETAPASIATEQFFKALKKKAKRLVKGAVKLAKKGLRAIGKLLPLNKIFAALRKMVQPLLKRVLQVALNRLPASVRPLAQTLAAKLFGNREAVETEWEGVDQTTATALTEAFDARLAEAILNPADAKLAELVTEAEAEARSLPHEPIAELDAARARLTQQLEAAVPGVAPLAELEQFVPVVMSALPIVRMGLKLIGRDKVVRFLANKLANLVKGHIGQQAAQMLAHPIVDVGMRLLSLEAESSASRNAVGMESIVATLEDTLRTVAELPADAFADPLRLEAETQEAFMEAAARHIPRALLSRNLRTVETGVNRGVWVYMPRVTRPCYRYKKYTHAFPVAISQPVARAVRFPAGDTLEKRLLDAGAQVWPVQAEVHLFETLPGTQLGHIAAFEAEAHDETGNVSDIAAEFEAFSPEIAGMLIHEPGLGLSPEAKRRTKRLFRIVAPGLRLRKRSRFNVQVDTSSTSPLIRIHYRLSEREGYDLSTALARKAFVQVIARLREVFNPAFRKALSQRLLRHLHKKVGVAVPPQRPVQLGERLAEGILGAVSKKLPESAPLIIQAVRDPAKGVTLTFEFRMADKEALLKGDPGLPSFTVRAGWHHG